MPLMAGAEPFAHDGSTHIGVLLCHGFTGTPASMRPWGRHLADTGFTVRCPRLPGHGTSWPELNRTRWVDWYGCVRAQLRQLTEHCEHVFVFGQSMGGTLALRLAQEFTTGIAGLVLVNPSVTTLRKNAKLLPVLSRFVPSIRGLGGDIAKPGVVEQSYPRVPLRAAASVNQLWRLVRSDLAAVTVPLLLAHSIVDHVVEPINSRIVLDGVATTNVTELLLRDSFHVATLDNDAAMLFDRSVDFVHAVYETRQVDPA